MKDTCIACGSELHLIYKNPFLDIQKYQQQIFECPNCKLGTVLPKINQADLNFLYDENYSQNPFFKTEESDKIPFSERIYRKYINALNGLYLKSKPKSFLRNVLTGSKMSFLTFRCIPLYINKTSVILDYGAGDGRFVNILRQAGYLNSFGYDINPASIQQGKSEGWFCDIMNEESKNKFDAIRMYHVIEHLADPIDFLKHINKLIKLNGELAFAVPSFVSPMVRIGKNGGFFHIPFHRHLFSEKSLDLLLEKTGFRLHKLITRSYGAGFISYVVNSKASFSLSDQFPFKFESLYNDAKGKGDTFEGFALKIKEI